ncbi:MAG: sterol desaturase family protein [Bacteroidota bacterium]
MIYQSTCSFVDLIQEEKRIFIQFPKRFSFTSTLYKKNILLSSMMILGIITCFSSLTAHGGNPIDSLSTQASMTQKELSKQQKNPPKFPRPNRLPKNYPVIPLVSNRILADVVLVSATIAWMYFSKKWPNFQINSWETFVEDIDIYVFHLITFWGSSIFFVITDYFQLFDKYKLNSMQPSPPSTVGTLVQVMINQLVSYPLISFFFPKDYDFPKNECDNTWYVSFLRLFGIYLANEVLFYALHRLLHNKRLYCLHKVHHEWTTPIGPAAFYCHPLEHIFVNIAPSVLGMYYTRSSKKLLLLWLTISMFHTNFTHSNFNARHEEHHQVGGGNYSGGLMDRLFGTYLEPDPRYYKRNSQ